MDVLAQIQLSKRVQIFAQIKATIQPEIKLGSNMKISDGLDTT